jgi:hypothetical protein
LIAPGKGLVCGNFGTARLHWTPCQGAWHGNCYKQMETDRFPIQSSREVDELDFEESDESAKEKDRFRVGRDGDHWICPFQCDLCHFQNVQRRPPGCDPRDEYFLLCIRRANLDALWASRALWRPTEERPSMWSEQRRLLVWIINGIELVDPIQWKMSGGCSRPRQCCLDRWIGEGQVNSSSTIQCGN